MTSALDKCPAVTLPFVSVFTSLRLVRIFFASSLFPSARRWAVRLEDAVSRAMNR